MGSSVSLMFFKKCFLAPTRPFASFTFHSHRCKGLKLIIRLRITLTASVIQKKIETSLANFKVLMKVK